MRGVELTWRGGEHAFLLNIDLMRALQQKCDAGPQWILARLSSGQWMVDDVIQPIRLGLEGGGVPKEEARRLVREHVEDRPLTQSVITAQAVLMSALYGSDEDSLGEQKAGTESPTVTRFPEENGSSQISTNGPE